MTKEYSANTMSEVYCFIHCLGEEYINKLPKKLYSFIDSKRNRDYEIDLDFDSNLDNQLSNDAFEFISYIDVQYWCDEDEKKELVDAYTLNEENYQKDLQEKYSYEKLFENNKKDKTENISETNQESSTNMIIYKESFFSKIINKIKRFFHR